MSRRGGFRGRGGGVLVGLIVTMFLIYLGLNFVSTFQGNIGNLTYGGTGIGATIFSMAQTWIMPLAIFGLLIYGVRKFLGGR